MEIGLTLLQASLAESGAEFIVISFSYCLALMFLLDSFRILSVLLFRRSFEIEDSSRTRYQDWSDSKSKALAQAHRPENHWSVFDSLSFCIEYAFQIKSWWNIIPNRKGLGIALVLLRVALDPVEWNKCLDSIFAVLAVACRVCKVVFSIAK